MKSTLWVSTVILLFAAAHVIARQTPATNTPPCNDPVATDSAAGKKKEAVEHDPLADPVEELRKRSQKKLEEKNFKELQAASVELADVSEKMSKEIDASGQYAISVRVLDDLDRIEKLTKKVRSLAK